MSSRLTRRDFVQVASGGAAALAGFSSLPVPALPRTGSFVNLANCWRDAAQHYLNVVRSGAGGAVFLKARDAAAKASIRLLDAAAASPRDVLIKYYVLYKAIHFTSFDLDFSEERFDAWCDAVEREADSFDLKVPPFWWRWWSHPPAETHERQKVAAVWSVVRPWEIRS